MVAVLAHRIREPAVSGPVSISIDERGVLLHVTDSEGHGIAIKLEPSTVLELAGSLQLAAAKLKTPEGKRTLLRSAVDLFSKLAGGDDGEKG
jgi:hypothetical protein